MQQPLGARSPARHSLESRSRAIRRACTAVLVANPTRSSTSPAAMATPTRCRRTYSGPGRRRSAPAPAPARVGGAARCRRRAPMAVPYRRSRSFSSAFMVMASRSPSSCAGASPRVSVPGSPLVGGVALRACSAWCSAAAARPRAISVAAPRSSTTGAPRLEGQLAGQQLVEHDAERVDVGPGVDVRAGGIRLLRAHVLRACRCIAPSSVKKRLVGERWPPWPWRCRSR